MAEPEPASSGDDINARVQTLFRALVRSKPDDHPELVAFREQKILHRNFLDAIEQAGERFQFAEQQGITAVIGPTGSGKTALAAELESIFTSAAKECDAAARPTMLSMELAAPERPSFDWKNDFYLPALIAMEEPCVAKKIKVQLLRDRVLSGDTKSVYAQANMTTVEFRNLFYHALDRARVRVGLFDEAGHLRRPSSKSGVFGQYDSIKSRSNAVPTHFTLLGTTEVIDILAQSGPISKRVYPIFLVPYAVEEIDVLMAGVAGIVEKMSRKIDFSLADKKADLFGEGLGQFGLVHERFERALTRTIEADRSVVTWRDMELARLSPPQRAGIVKDMIQFRDTMWDVTSYLDEKLKTIFLPAQEQAELKRERAAVQRLANTSPKGLGKLAPFERRPTRDRTGP